MTPIDENKVMLKYQATLSRSAFEKQMKSIIDSLSYQVDFKVTLLIEKA